MNLAIVFFLTPLIINSLGAFKYGIWILINSVVSYLSLMEAGVNISTGRFVNIAYSRGNIREASSFLSSSLAFYSLLPLIVAPLSLLIIALSFPESSNYVSIRSEVVASVFLAISALLVNLISSNVRIKLNTKHRFDLVALIEIIRLFFYALATLVYLEILSGNSLEILGLIVFSSALVGFVFSILLSNRYGVGFKLRLKYASFKTLKSIFGFSMWVMLSNLAVVSINHSDNFIISGLISVEAVSSYTIGFMISFYLTNMLSKINQIKNPEIQQLVGKSDLNMLTKLLNRLITNNLIFSVPVIICFYVFIDSFILLWLGEQFIESATVAKILAAPSICILFSQGAGSALWAKGLVKQLSTVKVFGALLNIVISVLFILMFDLSIIGVAFATSLVSFVECLIIIPYFFSKYIKINNDAIFLVPLGGICFFYAAIYATINFIDLKISDWLTLGLKGGVICMLLIGISYLLCSWLGLNIKHEN